MWLWNRESRMELRSPIYSYFTSKEFMARFISLVFEGSEAQSLFSLVLNFIWNRFSYDLLSSLSSDLICKNGNILNWPFEQVLRCPSTFNCWYCDWRIAVCTLLLCHGAFACLYLFFLCIRHCNQTHYHVNKVTTSTVHRRLQSEFVIDLFEDIVVG